MFTTDASTSARGARREPRFAVDLEAVLRREAGVFPVRLRDLSRSGALATCLFPPPALSSVTLVRGALSVEARVAWTGRGRFGLEFARPIRATDLLIQLSARRGSPAAPGQ